MTKEFQVFKSDDDGVQNFLSQKRSYHRKRDSSVNTEHVERVEWKYAIQTHLKTKITLYHLLGVEMGIFK